MPRQVATYDNVQHAAVTLISRGEVPTLERLRALIGHGSYSTICTHYQRFQDELKHQPKALWPTTVPESLIPGITTLWQTAMEAAEAQYQELKTEAQSRKSIRSR
jgi:hypothetical protein